MRRELWTRHRHFVEDLSIRRKTAIAHAYLMRHAHNKIVVYTYAARKGGFYTRDGRCAAA